MHDHIDFNMIIIIIAVYTRMFEYLTYTGIGKRMINNIANNQVMFVLVGHVTYTWLVHSHMHM